MSNEGKKKSEAKVLQVRAGATASDKLKRWIANQSEDPNGNTRFALEMFIDIFGEDNVKSSEVLEKLALYKRIAEGKQVEVPVNIVNTEVVSNSKSELTVQKETETSPVQTKTVEETAAPVVKNEQKEEEVVERKDFDF